MRIVFRVDASLQMGIGHTMRCLALAQALKKNGSNIEFVCRNHKGSLIDKIRLNGFNVFELGLPVEGGIDSRLPHSNWLGATQQQDARDCISVLKSIKIDWLIVDHYAIDEDWESDLQMYCNQLMVIDDLANRRHQCDILLDQTFGRQYSDYKALVPISCELLLGSKYALLRPEFVKWRRYSLERRMHPVFKRLLINMGGVDINNITKQVVKELATCNLPHDVEITIVMGGVAPHLQSIRSKVSDLACKTKIKIDVDNMAEIMANTDISIGAAGSTTWERCCLGLPTLQIIVAKNQEFSAKNLADHNAIKLLKEVKEIPSLLENLSDWIKTVSGSAAKICDGMGTYRVSNKISNCKIILEGFGEVELYNYVNLNADDKILMINMRNHPEVKKWMYNQNDISKEAHFDFIQSLEGDFERRYFLVKQKTKNIGSVSFSQIDLCNSVELGLYVNPFEHLKGAGKMLEAIAIHYAFIEWGVNKIKLEVLTNNERAINFYKKCGFKLIDARKNNNKKILYMEKEAGS